MIPLEGFLASKARKTRCRRQEKAGEGKLLYLGVGETEINKDILQPIRSLGGEEPGCYGCDDCD